MVGNKFMDEIDCGSFFDHIDDLLDFPTEDIDATDFPKPNAADSFPTLWQTHADAIPPSDVAVFSGNAAPDISAELSVPYEDIVQLEWLSNFCEDSFCDGGLTIKKEESFHKEDSSNNQFQTSSPVSVLDSSSSSSGGDKSGSSAEPHSPENTAVNRCGRARSKRPRPAAFNPRQAIQLISLPNPMYEPPELIVDPKADSESKGFGESRNVIKIPKRVITEHKKKKKMKLSVPLASAENHESTPSQNSASQPVRKCSHCDITKTPQWRAGPLGPKTLCNACGVRYKSGRLFPEYRPAASPTFVPSLHSNSHKKVLEMRNKSTERVAPVSPAAMDVPEYPVLIPNNNILQD